MATKEENNLYEEVTSYIKNCKDLQKLKDILIEVIDNNAMVNIQEIKNNHIHNFFELFKAGKKIKFRNWEGLTIKSILLNDEESSEFTKLVVIDNHGNTSTHSLSGQVYRNRISNIDLVLDI